MIPQSFPVLQSEIMCEGDVVAAVIFDLPQTNLEVETNPQRRKGKTKTHLLCLRRRAAQRPKKRGEGN